MEQRLLEQFGARVKDARIAKALSQEQLGSLADLDRTYVSGVERGKRNVSLVNIAKLAKALDLQMSLLLDFEVTDD
ncbi:MAG: transcriptional regulator with XRE-family HTH domain [Marinomonas primoryensis]|jgi:transcriptional regulator with XRE-family HTH domain